MDNNRMEILEAIDRIRELSNETYDEDVVVSSAAAIATLELLLELGFKKISIDRYNNM